MNEGRQAKADSPVAAEKARRGMDEIFQCMKDTVTIYRDLSDADAEALLKKFIEEE